ncbi:putative polyketide synthase [Xylariomycetidae sp. FL0641]|nr:putative polyketide synthase [Xylariomycetidae sp. FL0641]
MACRCSLPHRAMPLPMNEPIAIVGNACRFTGSANSSAEFWDLLLQPTDLRREIPSSRFSVKGFYHPDSAYHGHSNVSHAYLLDDDVDPAAFDAEFFGVKPVEAKAMDPQQRLLLEVVYEALESAGLSAVRMKGSDTAVYVGSMTDDYTAMLLRDLQDTPTYTAVGTSRTMLANRVSYVFDWHGASVSLDTACSASLVAVHMAVQTLRARDSRTAIACGTNLILGPENFIIESKLNMLSPDGRSKMWDQGANGYARGEGVAAVVLKTLSAAIQDGDHIECIIRETGLNQDGATAGITMPSAVAQESLIRKTYARAGLDLTVRTDRPQYFEAHGTGTPAGDPIEAEAIYNALGHRTPNPGDEPLYVGSVKTVIGHTEGTAGIAAIIKASLALQHARIPPNLWFDRLSDRVRPFYRNVEIPVTQRPWPGGTGQKRRASVNSFGFGGANAHAILESYDAKPQLQPRQVSGTLFTPFVFSASSQKSLAGCIRAYLEFLGSKKAECINAHDLAWTLRHRRSLLGWRVSFAASSLDELRRLLRACEEDTAGIGLKALPHSHNRIHGIFTGQGAQYARMGAALLEMSQKAREIIHQLEAYLSELPDGDAPSWSLEAELLASKDSRIHQSVISQPLCTAVQILLVDLLCLGGVRFHAVVGHSSGEIAAAYSAGLISARDAMCIAYYRGMHLQHAPANGAMVAVGTSIEDASELCADELFEGRIVVAANNSPSSVTIAGDEDAIGELETVLEDDKLFHRRLRVDRAYHSPHMLSIYEPYVASLRRCNISTRVPGPESATWYSSVYEGMTGAELNGLEATYWAENMVKPVLFANAVSSEFAKQPGPDVALEIGPHPALKGPFGQVSEVCLGKGLPYHGTLHRERDAVEAMSSAFGFLWTLLDPSCVNLGTYEWEMAGIPQGNRGTLVKDLPRYTWNHSARYWHESGRSRRMRTRRRQVHPLLGDLSPDTSARNMFWKQVVKIDEMRWLTGHRIDNRVVFPAAGYICTAIEASRCIAESPRLVEFHDFQIPQAASFDDETQGFEAHISMTSIKPQRSNRLSADFTYSVSMPGDHADRLFVAARCRVEITTGRPDPFLLPARRATLPNMLDVEPERFYTSLHNLGYGFSGDFQSLGAMYRKHHESTCLVKMGLANVEEGEENLLIHPAKLDTTLQSIILAHGHPFDEELRTLHLPTSFAKIRVNPAALCAEAGQQPPSTAAVDATVHEKGTEEQVITGDVSLHLGVKSNTALQLLGATFKPMTATVDPDDRKVFSKVYWIRSQPNGEEAARDIELTQHHHDLPELLERIALFFLGEFERLFPPDHQARSDFPNNWYFKFARYTRLEYEGGRNPMARGTWRGDTLGDVIEACKPFSHVPDVRIMLLVGTQMPRVFVGETTILEQFRASDILDEYYTSGLGVKEAAEWVGQSVKQIADRHAHMHILEIGAGTGGGTEAVLGHISQEYLSYTYTDVSTAFLDSAGSKFAQHRGMIFGTLDVERTPSDQGYEEGTYDTIVAFLVLHAISDIERCLSNIRSLLKPGGYLVVAEGHDSWNGFARAGFIWGTLPGWWLRPDARQTLSPHLTPSQWDKALRATGFSGVESSLPSELQRTLSMFCFVSQAVDHDIAMLRRPLTEPVIPLPTKCSLAGSAIETLALVGGKTPFTASLIEKLLDIFVGKGLALEAHHFKTLGDVDYDVVNSTATVISLTELDQPIFKSMTPETFLSLKTMFETGKTILWVTSGRRENDPYSNMMAGFGGVAANETPDLLLQLLDIECKASPEVIAEALLRFHWTAGRDNHFLWTVEPQILIDNNGQELLPRLRLIPELNDRYNAGRRPVVRDLQLHKLSGPVTLQQAVGTETVVVRELHRHSRLATEDVDTERYLELQTTCSTVVAIQTPFGPKFLALGLELATGKQYLALVPSLDSSYRLLKDSLLPLRDHLGLTLGQFVYSLSAHLLAMHILRQVLHGQTVWIHNSPIMVVKALDTQVAGRDIRVILTTDSWGREVPESWIRLPQYASESEIGQLVTDTNPSAFVSFSDADVETCENQETIMKSLKGRCAYLTTAEMMLSVVGSTDSRCLSVSAQQGTLKAALEYTRQTLLSEEVRHAAFVQMSCRLGDLAQGAAKVKGLIPRLLTVVDWTDPDPMPVRLSRLDTAPMFEGENSSYWIVGMSRTLGLSLVDWMIRKGARTVVLSTRKPEIDSRWIASHLKNGANVVVMPCDVTNMAEMQAIHTRMCATLPPIKGVINGAMVLRDVTIRNMTYDQLFDVIRPKVDGSANLDRLFQHTHLDFFVMMSSINRVCGNHGQANYAAANSFLWGLAAQRRKRGFRASAVDIGAIIGAGYLAREHRRDLDAIVERYAMLRMSEEDWCHAICEAIDVSRLDSAHGPGLTTGFGEVPLNAPKVPSWHTDPRFSSFVINHGPTHEKAEVKEAVAIGEQLRACVSKEDITQVIEESFAIKLRAMLQVTMTDQALMASRSAELGLDSLISVDIRSWFLKQLQVKVPILTIMGGNTLASIVQYAVENLPPELVPCLGVDGKIDKAEETSTSHSSSETLSVPAGSEEGDALGSTPAPMAKEYPGTRALEPPTTLQQAVFDWEAETRPPSGLTDAPSIPDNHRPSSPPRVVVLTGCTGLLGHHLLSYLLAQPGVQKVICLAVRSLPSRVQRDGLPSPDSRVSYHAGDLGEPLLGLTEEEAFSIFAEADIVIHNGANTSHILPYSDVRAENLGSTTALVRLCIPRQIPLHYVSSAGLGLWHDKSRTVGFPPGPVKLSKKPDSSFGYLCSKWVCERLLERTSETHGLRVCIHRPSTIVRKGDDALGWRAELDWINAFLVYSERLRAVPKAERNRGNLDLIDVKTACDMIIARAFPGVQNGTSEQVRVTYVHMVGDKRLPLGSLRGADHTASNQTAFDVLPLEDWIARAVAAGLHPGVAALIEAVEEEEEDYPKLMKGVRDFA